MTSPVTYAIGDVHGEADRLRQMHALIFDRHAHRYGDRPMRVIHLGDYVDRGPDSFSVIEQLINFRQRAGLSMIALAGNHEAMMLTALTGTSKRYCKAWMSGGGDKTMESYNHSGRSDALKAHLDWIATLPSIFIDASERLVFVHAGLSRESFPEGPDEVHLWTRSQDFFDVSTWQGTALEGWTVIHGHTPTSDGFPEDASGAGRRINIDTGAVFGGRLTCAVLARGEDVRFLYA